MAKSLMSKLVLWEVDAHLVLFEDDSSTTTLRDFFFHGGKFIGKKISQALKSIVGKEEESLGDAGGAEAKPMEPPCSSVVGSMTASLRCASGISER